MQTFKDKPLLKFTCIQDLRDKIWDLLRHLTRLRVFKINKDTTISFVNTEFGCLIGAEYDPNDRGHPSLELLWIGFLSHHWLVWVHGEGWIRREEYTVHGQMVPNAGGMPCASQIF